MQNQFNKSLNRVLVTGGSGFIGGALIRNILINTNAQIFNLDKMGYASDLLSIHRLIKNLGSKGRNRHFLLKTNLSNPQKTFEAVQKANPDIIINLAAESHVDRSIQGPYNFIQSNIVGTFNLLDSAYKYYEKLPINRKLKFKFLHVSTDEVFGSLGKKGYFSENSPYSPNSPYSASKASSDHLVKAWYSTYKLPTLITNCSNNFGPWQFPEKLIPLTIIKALSNKEIPVYGKGQNVRDWLYVEDHVDALLEVSNHGKVGENYCIGGSNEKKNIEVVNLICEMLDKKLPINKSYKELITYVKDRPGHDLRYAINNQKILEDLNWKPKFTFQDALNITVDWCIHNQEWLNQKFESLLN